MSDLVAFLNVRLDEDEAVAREIQAALDSGWNVPTKLIDPARVLGEVDAKRRILAYHSPDLTDYIDGDGIERASYECTECEPPGTPDNWPCRTLRAIAAVYSDHPDYDPAWA